MIFFFQINYLVHYIEDLLLSTSDFPLMTNDAFNDMTFFPFYLSVPISYLRRGYSSLNGPWLWKLCNVRVSLHFNMKTTERVLAKKPF